MIRAGLAIIIVMFLAVGVVEYYAEPINVKIINEAAERGANPPSLVLSHPLGCQETRGGKQLRATVQVEGERRPRCYYQ